MTAPDDPAALTELQALFTSLPPDDMPDDVTERVLSALAELPPPRAEGASEGAGEATPEPEPLTGPEPLPEPVPIDAYRARRRRTRRILTVAAALLLGAGGTVGLVDLLKSSTVTSGNTASGAVETGRASMRTAVPDAAGPLSNESPSISAFTSADLESLATRLEKSAPMDVLGVAGVTVCVDSGFQGGAAPFAAQAGSYDGRAALLLLYQDPSATDRFDAYLVATPCAPSGTTVLEHASLSK